MDAVARFVTPVIVFLLTLASGFWLGLLRFRSYVCGFLPTC